MNVRLAVLLPFLLLLTSCVEPTGVRVEHVGTLPAASYASFDHLAQGKAVKVLGGRYAPPEPKWVFALNAPLDPRAAPLRIGSFTGQGEVPARVASNLPEELRESLDALHLFPSVTLSPIPHAYVLSGIVTRADDQDEPGLLASDPATQVEATLTRNGVTIGAIQVNAVQIGITPMSLLPSMLLSAGQGSRAAFISNRFADIFARIGAGEREGINAGGMNARYLRAAVSKPAG